MNRAALHIVRDEEPRQVRGPSPTFVRLTRNPALVAPSRFEPTVKGADDVCIANPALVAWKASRS